MFLNGNFISVICKRDKNQFTAVFKMVTKKANQKELILVRKKPKQSPLRTVFTYSLKIQKNPKKPLLPHWKYLHAQDFTEQNDLKKSRKPQEKQRATTPIYYQGCKFTWYIFGNDSENHSWFKRSFKSLHVDA